MKVLASNAGRLVVLKPIDELVPDSGVSTTELPQLLVQRYGFTYTTPIATPFEQVQKDGFKYQMGKLTTSDGIVAIKELAIYNDGIVISAMNTEVAEAFLSDLTQWLVTSFNFKIQGDTSKRRLYASELTVQFDKSANNLLNAFDKMSDALNHAYRAIYPGLAEPLQAHTFAFDFDRSKTPSVIGPTGAFKLERRINEPFEDNKFFSIAPLRTGDHISFLKVLEGVM